MDVYARTLRQTYGDLQNYFDVLLSSVRTISLSRWQTSLPRSLRKNYDARKIKQDPIDFVFGLRRYSILKWYPIEDFRRSMTILQHSFCLVVFFHARDHQFQSISSQTSTAVTRSADSRHSPSFFEQLKTNEESICLKKYVQSRPRRSSNDCDISCIRRVLASIVVVRGAAQDSLPTLLSIRLYHTLLGKLRWWVLLRQVYQAISFLLKNIIFNRHQFQSSTELKSIVTLTFWRRGWWSLQSSRLCVGRHVYRATFFRDLWWGCSVVPQILIFQSIYMLFGYRMRKGHPIGLVYTRCSSISFDFVGRCVFPKKDVKIVIRISARAQDRTSHNT